MTVAGRVDLGLVGFNGYGAFESFERFERRSGVAMADDKGGATGFAMTGAVVDDFSMLCLIMAGSPRCGRAVVAQV